MKSPKFKKSFLIAAAVTGVLGVGALTYVIVWNFIHHPIEHPVLRPDDDYVYVNGATDPVDKTEDESTEEDPAEEEHPEESTSAPAPAPAPPVQATLPTIGNSDAGTAEVTGGIISEEAAEQLPDEGVHYEVVNYNRNYYPYYGMLNAEEQDLYNQFLTNALARVQSFRPTVPIIYESAAKVIEAVFYDHPELFWLDTGAYMDCIGSDQKCVKVARIQFVENSLSSNYIIAKSNFDAKVNAIVAGASGLGSNYAKEKYVHDAIIDNTLYDVYAANHQSAYSALVAGRSVCAGYARAFQLIMTKLGIPTYYVVGKGVAGVDHAWNLVQLDDGQFYNVDLTWNDTTMSKDYFNLETVYFAQEHTRAGLSTALPAATGTAFLGY